MRMRVPGLKCGKRDGYRVIYSLMYRDEVAHIVFVSCYFKGDKADLSEEEYRAAEAEAQAAYGDKDTPWVEDRDSDAPPAVEDPF